MVLFVVHNHLAYSDTYITRGDNLIVISYCIYFCMHHEGCTYSNFSTTGRVLPKYYMHMQMCREPQNCEIVCSSTLGDLWGVIGFLVLGNK